MHVPPRRVRLGDKSTEVVFSQADTLQTYLPETSCLYVFDRNTRALVSADRFGSVVLEPGETEKNWRSIDLIETAALEAGLDRGSVFVGVGGGVVCDMTAFAAAIYMRGCDVVLVPTTLLAMVDASIGGKSGIDFNGLKNMLGMFHPASRVVVCPSVLSTLEEREYRSGLAEVAKAALLGNHELFDLLRNEKEAVFRRDLETVSRLVDLSIATKAEIVEADFTEQGIRAHLNLGHTFAHALESTTGFVAWKHGEAVAWGIGKALQLGVLLGVTDPAYSREATFFFSELGFRLEAGRLDVDRFIRAMYRDKKGESGKLRLVLQRGFGDTFIQYVDEADVRSVLSR